MTNCGYFFTRNLRMLRSDQLHRLEKLGMSLTRYFLDTFLIKKDSRLLILLILLILWASAMAQELSLPPAGGFSMARLQQNVSPRGDCRGRATDNRWQPVAEYITSSLCFWQRLYSGLANKKSISWHLLTYATYSTYAIYRFHTLPRELTCVSKNSFAGSWNIWKPLTNFSILFLASDIVDLDLSVKLPYCWIAWEDAVVEYSEPGPENLQETFTRSYAKTHNQTSNLLCQHLPRRRNGHSRPSFSFISSYNHLTD